jgi:dipeptidase E
VGAITAWLISELRNCATVHRTAIQVFQVRTLDLALTSDFPSTITSEIVTRIRATAREPRVAWIPPNTAAGRERFDAAQAQFQLLGVSAVEFCDIDEEPDKNQLAHLDEYDVLYFTGGDPLAFRANMERWRLGETVRKSLAAGRLVVGASGGAMQFTQNVSLYRLLSCTVERILAERGEYAALGLVDYEILPHLNRLDQPFLEKVARYSQGVPHDVIALEDGSAVICADGQEFRCVGRAERFRGGVRSPIHAAA